MLLRSFLIRMLLSSFVLYLSPSFRWNLLRTRPRLGPDKKGPNCRKCRACKPSDRKLNLKQIWGSLGHIGICMYNLYILWICIYIYIYVCVCDIYIYTQYISLYIIIIYYLLFSKMKGYPIQWFTFPTYAVVPVCWFLSSPDSGWQAKPGLTSERPH